MKDANGHKNVKLTVTRFKKFMILSKKEFCDKIIFLADKGAVYIYMSMNGLWETDGQSYS